jgi:hypothetical protein
VVVDIVDEVVDVVMIDEEDEVVVCASQISPTPSPLASS